MTQNGKGDKPRPMAVDAETWDKNWSQIFKKKGKKNGPKTSKTKSR